METLPVVLRQGQIAATPAREWDIVSVALNCLPLGYCLHHRVATGRDGTKRFVTVDAPQASHLAARAVMSSEWPRFELTRATALRNAAALAFVGPVAASGSQIIHRIGGHSRFAAFPFLAVAPSDHGGLRNPTDRVATLALIDEIHKTCEHTVIEALTPSGHV